MKNKILNEKIGFEMRSERLLKRMTLEQVAKEMGYASKNTVSYLELGKTDIDVVSLIDYCRVVGCDWKDVLMRASGEKNAGV